MDWVLLNSSVERSRNMVVGMWQALLDAGVLTHSECVCVRVCVCVCVYVPMYLCTVRMCV